MKNFNRFTSLILCGVLLLGGGTLHACAKNKAPEWVVNRVSDANYYIGIGYAPKVKKSTAHYDLAAQNALNDLASEISVSISASTLMITIEDDKQLKDDFTSIIKARAQKDIEGYEKVASYEDRKGYWVYYRLSKSQYAATQARKRRLAVESAKVFYLAAQEAEQKMDYKTAIIDYAKALDAVKAYLNEQILVTVDSTEINLTQVAYSRSYELLNSLQLRTVRNEVTCKMGESIPESDLVCSLQTSKGKPIANFPVMITYSERSVQNANKFTDDQGKAGFVLPIVRSRKSVETIRFALDINKLLLESAVDFAVRRWLVQIPVQDASMQVSVVKPSVFIESIEQNLSQASSRLVLAPMFEHLFLNAGYFISTNRQKADYILKIATNTTAKSQSNGLYSTALNGQIQLYYKDRVVYDRFLNNISGTQLDYVKAGLSAYEEGARQIEIRYFREFEAAIVKQ